MNSEFTDPLDPDFMRAYKRNEEKVRIRKQRKKLITLFSFVYVALVLLPAAYFQITEGRAPSLIVWWWVVGIYLVTITGFDLWNRFRL